MTSLLLATLVHLLAANAPTAAGTTAPCTCAAAKPINGWCEAHAVGYVGDIPIKSKELFEALDAHGHEIDFGSLACPSCKSASATGGFCDQHHIGFVGRLAYFSRLTYELARGERVDPAKIKCPTCRKNAESHGWCAKDKLGRIGHVAIADQAAYRRAEHAIEIVMLAVAAAPRCDMCAAAIVLDTECPICRITYKDGHPVDPGAARQGPPVADPWRQ